MTKEEIGQILKELRLSSGKTQKEVAELLGRKQQIVGHWETGYSQPDTNTLFTLCDIYGTTVDAAFGFKKSNITISKKDIEFIQKYQKLDVIGQEHIETILQWEIDRMKGYTECSDNNIITLMEIQSRRDPALLLPYWENGVSAGNGIYQLNDTASVMLSLWATELTKQADFIIKVSGSSMEPDFHDGDKVLVNRKVNVEVGEVGIFVKNGETYIKELGNGELISRNSEYQNIQVNDYDNVVCLGKVIGTLRDEMIAKE